MNERHFPMSPVGVTQALATRECLDLRLLELIPPLAALCPPATVIDKTRYSALAEPKLA